MRRPFAAAVVNLTVVVVGLLLSWLTERPEYVALLASICLPLSLVIVHSILRELDAHPRPCRERRAAHAAGALLFVAVILALAAAAAFTGPSPFSIRLR
jgi:hydrogenase-4 membrane subunit HyfE